jgi:hypothetical protein
VLVPYAFGILNLTRKYRKYVNTFSISSSFGPIVYRLGHRVFIPARGVRLSLGSPILVNRLRLALRLVFFDARLRWLVRLSFGMIGA